jgi:uracil-DNA glycosylase
VVTTSLDGSIGASGTGWVVMLDGAADVDGFRSAARWLFARDVAPERVRWRTHDAAEGELFDGGAAPADAGRVSGRTPKVPPSFAALVAAAALHCDPQRFALLYRLLWRLQREPQLRTDPLDRDWLTAQQLARAVNHDLHKAKAFVRFRPVGEGRLHVAWFEPEHHVVEAVAPFFVERFSNLRWTLLTPLRSAAWDGERLCFGPGARREQAPGADEREALWLTYYAHIFNPARLKLAMMQREMPRRYWKNLPEAVLIQPLAARAHERSARMVEQVPTEPARTIRRIAAAAAVPTEATPESLCRAASACTACPLHAQATQVVFGEGPADARLMFVGEQPGDQEDLHGRPFVGPAGQLFDRALAELGIDRASVYVTNAVKHFKYELRGQRRIHKTPSQQEAAACLDWLERELALVKPEAVVALGATAARSLLGRPVAVMRERGQWVTREDGLRVLVTLHPSALLRMEPGEREAAYRAWVAELGSVGWR